MIYSTLTGVSLIDGDVVGDVGGGWESRLFVISYVERRKLKKRPA